MLLLPVLLPLLLLPLLQVYAASIMFGYFLRRVDKRFQLESALGMIDTPADTEEAVARLERLFAQVREVVRLWPGVDTALHHLTFSPIRGVTWWVGS